MTLEDILKDIELRGKQELQDLTQYYGKRISEIEAKQKLASDALRDRISRSTEEEKRSIEKTILSSAEMESLKIHRTKESSLIHEAVERAELYLRSLRKSKDYAVLLEQMIRVSRDMLGKNCTIYLGKDDILLLKEKDASVIAQEVDPYGGIKSVSADRSKELDLTISTIMKEIREKLISKFSDHLGE